MEDHSSEAVVSTTSDMECSSICGEPIQIVKIDDEGDHSFYLDETALSKIMGDERIRDKPLCIVSVAGKLSISSASSTGANSPTFYSRGLSSREVVHA